MRPYPEALPALFPWAVLEPDGDLIDQRDEQEWMDETGVWDNEEKAYVGNAESFAEWRTARYRDGELRPYGNEAGEVDLWRLSLTLNELGRGFLALERFVSS